MIQRLGALYKWSEHRNGTTSAEPATAEVTLERCGERTLKGSPPARRCLSCMWTWFFRAFLTFMCLNTKTRIKFDPGFRMVSRNGAYQVRCLESFNDTGEELGHLVRCLVRCFDHVVSIVEVVFRIVVVRLVGDHGHAEYRNV